MLIQIYASTLVVRHKQCEYHQKNYLRKLDLRHLKLGKILIALGILANRDMDIMLRNYMMT